MKGGQVGRAGQRKKTGTRGVAPAGPSPFLTAMRHGPASETLCSHINVLPGHLGSETNSALLPAARPPPSTRPENRPLIALEGPFLPPEPRPPLTQRPGCQSSPPHISHHSSEAPALTFHLRTLQLPGSARKGKVEGREEQGETPLKPLWSN